MAKFFEGGADGAGVFATDVDTIGLGFGGGGHKVFNGLVDSVKGAIDEITVGPTEVIVYGGTTTGLRVENIGGVGGDFEDRITIIVAGDGVLICV